MEIAGTNAFVTGANRGIGQQLVKALLEAGADKVYAAARDLRSLEQTCALNSDKVVPVELDVTNESQSARAVASARDANLLINNAAFLEFGSAASASVQSLRRHLEVNVLGLFVVTQAFAQPHKASRLEAVVNILSLIALNNASGMACYSASKYAAWSLTQSFREYLISRGIAVHAVFPGAVNTDMLASVNMPKANPLAVARAILNGIAAGHEVIYPDAQSTRWASLQRPMAARV